MITNIILLILAAVLTFFSVRGVRKRKGQRTIFRVMDMISVLIGTYLMGLIIWLTIQGVTI